MTAGTGSYGLSSGSEEHSGKVVLVTGGTSGIGRRAAEVFAAAGMRVVLTGRRATEGEEVAEKIRAQGYEAHFVRADVSQAVEVEALFETLLAAYDRLDYAFNNAGATRGGTLTEMSEDDFDVCFDVNAKGLWLCMKHEITHMRRQGSGSIVNNTSVHGFRTVFPGIAAYVAAKHAAVALTRIAALENAAAGIRVNGIAPGPIATEMLMASEESMGGATAWKELIPAGRVGEVDEVIPLVQWLFSDAASYINGQVIGVDGGFLGT